MAVYTNLNLVEINAILDNYNIAEAHSFENISHGITNSNYKISTSLGKYNLKISNDKKVDQLHKEHEILFALKNAGFKKCLLPLKTSLSDYVFKFENLNGAIFPFVDAHPVTPSMQSVYKLGECLGLLHKAGEKLQKSSIRKYQEVGHDINQLKIIREDFPEDFNFELTKIINKYPSVRSLETTDGLVHGDFYYDNALFKNEELLFMLDFEQSGIGNYIFDLGIAISGSCIRDENLNLELINNYIKGYKNTMPLNESQEKSIPLAIIFGLFSISYWRIERFYLGNLDSTKRNNYKELINRAIQYEKSI